MVVDTDDFFFKHFIYFYFYVLVFPNHLPPPKTFLQEKTARFANLSHRKRILRKKKTKKNLAPDDDGSNQDDMPSERRTRALTSETCATGKTAASPDSSEY